MGLKPLKNIRVIDITEGVAGPYASQYLGDLGAEVIKVERPAGDWGRTMGVMKNGFSTQYIALNRNKKNICIDIKTEEGRQILKRLIQTSDIIISSFRPGVMEKNGFSHEKIKLINPNIINGRISGYGYNGRLNQLTGVDTVTQAVSGIMSQIGPIDGPPYRVSFPLVDQVAARDLVSGLLAALIQREQTGNVKGPIDVSLFATAAALQGPQWQDYFETGKVHRRSGNQNPVIAPAATYETLDGKYISIAIVREQQWIRFCKALGLEELAELDKFKNNRNRVKHRDELEEIIIETFLKKDSDYWIEKLNNYDLTFGTVNNLEDISNNEELMNAIPKVSVHFEDEEVTSIGLPFIYDNKMHSSASLPPSHKGQHTEEILYELGFNPEEIKKYEKAKIIYISHLK